MSVNKELLIKLFSFGVNILNFIFFKCGIVISNHL